MQFNQMALKFPLSPTATEELQESVTSRKSALSALCIVYLLEAMVYTFTYPLFPKEASLKGLSGTMVGLILSVESFIMIPLLPVLGLAMRRTGARGMFLTGLVIKSMAIVLFGLTELTQDKMSFAWQCFFAQTLLAIASASTTAGGNAILMSEFGDTLGTVYGLTKAAYRLGTSLGPPVGGLIYEYGGFGLPFYALGALMVLSFVLCFNILKTRLTLDVPTQAKMSYVELLRSPKVVVLTLAIICAVSSLSFLNPTLEPHFRKYDMSAIQYGLVFFAVSSIASLTAPIVGWWTERVPSALPLIVVGLFGMAIGWTFLGPSALVSSLGVAESLPLDILSTVTLLTLYSLAYIPTFPAIVQTVTSHGALNNVATQGIVSGWFACAENLGDVFGTSMGGLLVDKLGFAESSGILVIYLGFVASVVTVSFIVESRKENSDENEMKRLLHSFV